MLSLLMCLCTQDIFAGQGSINSATIIKSDQENGKAIIVLHVLKSTISNSFGTKDFRM